jgi:hypothetical protein
MTNIAPPPARLRSRESVADTGVSLVAREFPTISLRGRAFTLLDTDGSEKELPGKTLQVVVVDALPAVGRKYYEEAYSQDNNVGPTCWSNDGQTPAANVSTPCAVSCAACPMAAAGSGADGRSAACGFVKPLAVYLADDQSERPVLYRIDVKAMSLFGGRQQVGYLPWLGSKDQPGYVSNLYKNFMGTLPETNRHFSNVVTEIAFTGDSVPAIGFRFVDWIGDFDVDYMGSLKLEDYAKMFEVTTRGEAAARRALESKQSAGALPAPAAARRGAGAAQARTQAQEKEAETAPTTGRRGAAQAQAEETPAAPRGRRGAAPAQEVLPPEAPAAGRGRRGAAPPSRLDPAVISGDDGDQDIAGLAARLAGMGGS